MKAAVARIEPAPDKIAQLNALAGKIERHRAELDAFLDEYAKVIGQGTPGVPVVNIRMTLDGRGRCLCHSTDLAINDQIAALELEQKT